MFRICGMCVCGSLLSNTSSWRRGGFLCRARRAFSGIFVFNAYSLTKITAFGGQPKEMSGKYVKGKEKTTILSSFIGP